MKASVTRRADILTAILVGVVTFGVSFLFALRGVDPHHQGFLLKSAVDVSRGLALYRETFTQYGSLAVYLLVPGIWLFGESIAAINAVTCVAYALCGMLLYRIVRRYANAVVAALCPLVAIGMAAFYFWNFHPWPSVFALLFSLAATECMILFLESRNNAWLAACGAATAAMFWCRQPQGLSALAGVFILTGLYAVGFDTGRGVLKSLLVFILGNLAVHAALLGVLAAQGAVGDWWIQAMKNALAFAAEPTAETAAARPESLWKIIFVGLNDNPRYDFVWRVLTYGSLLYLLLLLGVAIARSVRGRRRERPDTALLGCIAFAVFALFNWPQYFPTLCYRHVFWSDYPMFGVLGVALYQAAGLLTAGCGAAGWGERSMDAAAAARAVTGKRRALCTALVCALLPALCAGNLLARARIGKSRLTGGGNGAVFYTIEAAEPDTVIRYHNDDYGYLNGLYLSARETRFYDGLFGALARLQARYPEKNIVNLTPNALFSVFTSENPHLRPFDNDPRDFGYPEQMDATSAYIAQNRPIVISHEPLPGYETAAYLTDFNGDIWRFAPVYVLEPLQ